MASTPSRAGIQGKYITNPNPPGLITRIGQAMQYVWFGPGEPMQPTAPPGTEPRTWEYPPGWNISARPRSGEDIGFPQLRGLANTYDLLRLVIETRKDQLAALSWNFRIKPDPSDPDAAQDDGTDPRIDKLVAFFQSPDLQTDWAGWLRQVVEEILVTDALAIYRRPSLGEAAISYELMDGAMIKPLVDEAGRIVAYEQWLYGTPAYQFPPKEIYYIRRNPRVAHVYGFSPTEQVVITTNIALRRQYAQLAWFTKGNIPEGFLTAPKGWDPVQIDGWQKRFDAYMSGNPDARSGLVMLPEGSTPLFPKAGELKDEFDEWLARVVCYAFSIPPTPFIKQMNRAGAANQEQEAKDEGLAPLMDFIAGSVVNRIVRDGFGFDDIEFVWEQHEELEPLPQAQIHEIYVRNGIESIDEARDDLGRDALGVGPALITPMGLQPLFPVPDIPVPKPEPEPQPVKLLPAGAGPAGSGAAPSPPKVQGDLATQATKDVLQKKNNDSPKAARTGRRTTRGRAFAGYRKTVAAPRWGSRA